MKSILNLIKKYPKSFWLIVAIILVVVVMLFFKNKNTGNRTIKISHSDFVNQVSVSGKVVAAEKVDLGFKNEGIIEKVFFSVGGGAVIAAIDAGDAEKDVRDAEVALASAKLSLQKIQLKNSNENLNADLTKSYEDGFNAVSSAFLDLSDIIDGLDDVLSDDNVSDNSARISGKTALSYRSEAEKLYYQAQNLFEANRKIFREMNRSSPGAEVETIAKKTYETAKIFADAVKSAKNFVDYMAEDSNDSSSFSDLKTTLSDYTDTVSEHLTELITAETNIKNYKDAFTDTSLDLEDAFLSIKQRENALSDARNKLSDYYIRASFDGVITKIDAKVGEIASANKPLVTLMSAGTFQIESYVPEVNIALIKEGAPAKVTLDAYGENVFFSAKVASIDPAETIRDGVSTYRIKLQFDSEDDRIKSGMTANVSIIIFNKENVIVLPGGVVFQEAGKNFVQVKEEGKISNREILLGEVSSLGQVEVVEGLADGEEVVLNPNALK